MMKLRNYLFIIALLFNYITYSQSLINSGSLIQGGIEDGQKLLNAYITPINKAIVFGLSDVTYTKFRDENDSKKLTIGVKLAYISIPDEDLTYDISKLDMTYIEAKDPNNSIAQSVFGDSLKTITLSSKQKDFFGRPLFEFESPTGGQKNALPLPSVDLNYRLKGTNIAVNFIPYVEVPTSDMKVGMIGGSIQQDLSVLIKNLKNKPFKVSLQGSASYLFGNAALDVQPEGVSVPVTLNGNATGPYNNQEINTHYTSLQIGAYFDYILAEKYTFFAGGAYNTGTAKILILGNYPIYAADPTHTGSVVVEDIKDPIDISESFNRVKFELGARADWNRIYLQLNYNMADYGGIGLNVGYKLF